jgi:hypothetical protein
MKCLQQKTRANQEHYKEQRTGATKVSIKKLWLNNKIIQTDKINERNQTKKCTEEVKYFNQQQSTSPTNCKDSENNVISQT